MVVKQETPVSEAILSVFRELGLEDERVRNQLQALSCVDDWRVWQEDRYEEQDTRGNTLIEVSESNA